MNKIKKLMKSKKYADFGQIGKISAQLDDEYYENGEKMIKSEKFKIISLKCGLKSKN